MPKASHDLNGVLLLFQGLSGGTEGGVNLNSFREARFSPFPGCGVGVVPPEHLNGTKVVSADGAVKEHKVFTRGGHRLRLGDSGNGTCRPKGNDRWPAEGLQDKPHTEPDRRLPHTGIPQPDVIASKDILWLFCREPANSFTAELIRRAGFRSDYYVGKFRYVAFA
jgi:hypothetical protein